MALSDRPVFPQTPKMAFAKLTAANTSLDGSGTITTLLTAGADGAVVTSLQARCQATVTASALRIFISLNGGSTWALWEEKLMGAYTVANTACACRKLGPGQRMLQTTEVRNELDSPVLLDCSTVRGVFS